MPSPEKLLNLTFSSAAAIRVFNLIDCRGLLAEDGASLSLNAASPALLKQERYYW